MVSGSVALRFFLDSEDWTSGTSTFTFRTDSSSRCVHRLPVHPLSTARRHTIPAALTQPRNLGPQCDTPLSNSSGIQHPPAFPSILFAAQLHLQSPLYSCSGPLWLLISSPPTCSHVYSPGSPLTAARLSVAAAWLTHTHRLRKTIPARASTSSTDLFGTGRGLLLFVLLPPGSLAHMLWCYPLRRYITQIQPDRTRSFNTKANGISRKSEHPPS